MSDSGVDVGGERVGRGARYAGVVDGRRRVGRVDCSTRYGLILAGIALSRALSLSLSRSLALSLTRPTCARTQTRHCPTSSLGAALAAFRGYGGVKD